jgi:hypothetical protein
LLAHFARGNDNIALLAIAIGLDVHSSDMADHDAESSSQALERYITAQLAALDLDVPSDDVSAQTPLLGGWRSRADSVSQVEYMARFVEEEGLERVEKVEGVKGMLEGVVGEVSHEQMADLSG